MSRIDDLIREHEEGRERDRPRRPAGTGGSRAIDELIRQHESPDDASTDSTGEPTGRDRYRPQGPGAVGAGDNISNILPGSEGRGERVGEMFKQAYHGQRLHGAEQNFADSQRDLDEDGRHTGRPRRPREQQYARPGDSDFVDTRRNYERLAEDPSDMASVESLAETLAEGGELPGSAVDYSDPSTHPLIERQRQGRGEKISASRQREKAARQKLPDDNLFFGLIGSSHVSDMLDSTALVLPGLAADVIFGTKGFSSGLFLYNQVFGQKYAERREQGHGHEQAQTSGRRHGGIEATLSIGPAHIVTRALPKGWQNAVKEFGALVLADAPAEVVIGYSQMAEDFYVENPDATIGDAMEHAMAVPASDIVKTVFLQAIMMSSGRATMSAALKDNTPANRKLEVMQADAFTMMAEDAQVQLREEGDAATVDILDDQIREIRELVESGATGADFDAGLRAIIEGDGTNAEATAAVDKHASRKKAEELAEVAREDTEAMRAEEPPIEITPEDQARAEQNEATADAKAVEALLDKDLREQNQAKKAANAADPRPKKPKPQDTVDPAETPDARLRRVAGDDAASTVEPGVNEAAGIKNEGQLRADLEAADTHPVVADIGLPQHQAESAQAMQHVGKVLKVAEHQSKGAVKFYQTESGIVAVGEKAGNVNGAVANVNKLLQKYPVKVDGKETRLEMNSGRASKDRATSRKARLTPKAEKPTQRQKTAGDEVNRLRNVTKLARELANGVVQPEDVSQAAIDELGITRDDLLSRAVNIMDSRKADSTQMKAARDAERQQRQAENKADREQRGETAKAKKEAKSEQNVEDHVDTQVTRAAESAAERKQRREAKAEAHAKNQSQAAARRAKEKLDAKRKAKPEPVEATPPAAKAPVAVAEPVKAPATPKATPKSAPATPKSAPATPKSAPATPKSEPVPAPPEATVNLDGEVAVGVPAEMAKSYQSVEGMTLKDIIAKADGDSSINAKSVLAWVARHGETPMQRVLANWLYPLVGDTALVSADSSILSGSMGRFRVSEKNILLHDNMIGTIQTVNGKDRIITEADMMTVALHEAVHAATAARVRSKSKSIKPHKEAIDAAARQMQEWLADAANMDAMKEKGLGADAARLKRVLDGLTDGKRVDETLAYMFTEPGFHAVANEITVTDTRGQVKKAFDAIVDILMSLLPAGTQRTEVRTALAEILESGSALLDPSIKSSAFPKGNQVKTTAAKALKAKRKAPPVQEPPISKEEIAEFRAGMEAAAKRQAAERAEMVENMADVLSTAETVADQKAIAAQFIKDNLFDGAKDRDAKAIEADARNLLADQNAAEFENRVENAVDELGMDNSKDNREDIIADLDNEAGVLERKRIMKEVNKRLNAPAAAKPVAKKTKASENPVVDTKPPTPPVVPAEPVAQKAAKAPAKGKPIKLPGEKKLEAMSPRERMVFMAEALEARTDGFVNVDTALLAALAQNIESGLTLAELHKAAQKTMREDITNAEMLDGLMALREHEILMADGQMVVTPATITATQKLTLGDPSGIESIELGADLLERSAREILEAGERSKKLDYLLDSDPVPNEAGNAPLLDAEAREHIHLLVDSGTVTAQQMGRVLALARRALDSGRATPAEYRDMATLGVEGVKLARAFQALEKLDSTTVDVTSDSIASVKKNISSKMGRLNSGLDPSLMVDYTKLGLLYIRKGASTLAEFATQMVNDLGPRIGAIIDHVYVAAMRINNTPIRRAVAAKRAREGAVANAVMNHPDMLDMLAESRARVTDDGGTRVSRSIKKGREFVSKTGKKLSRAGTRVADRVRAADKFELRKVLQLHRLRTPFRDKAREAQILRDARIMADEKRVNWSLQDLEVAIDAVYGGRANMTDVQVNKLNAALHDKALIKDLDPLLQPFVERMREHIDMMSRRAVRLDVLTGDLKIIVDKNLGSYVHRAYDIAMDPHYKVKPEAKDALMRWLDDTYGEVWSPEMIREEATRIMTPEWAAFYKTEGPGAGLDGPLLGAKNLKSLKGRSDVPRAIRDVWGEVVDIRRTYEHSIANLSHLSANHEFQAKARELGLAEGWLSKEKNLDTGQIFLLAKAGDARLSPLTGFGENIYATKEIRDAFMDAAGYADIMRGHFGALYQGVVSLNSTAKFSKTVLNPVTHARNYVSNPGFTTAMGHFWWMDTIRDTDGPADFSGKAMIRAHQIMWRDFAGHTKYGKVLGHDGRKAILEAIELGVLYDGVHAGEIQDIRGDLRPGFKNRAGKAAYAMAAKMGDALGIGPNGKSKAAKFVQNHNDKTIEAYQMEDNIWKFYTYMMEIQQLTDAWGDTWTNDQIKHQAAQNVRAMMPAYSLIPEIAKVIRKFPLYGPFIAFPVASAQAAYGVMDVATQELASNNPRVRGMGARRLAGMTMVAGALPAVAAAFMYWNGVSQEEADALTYLQPEGWYRHGNLFYMGRDKDGNHVSIDSGHSEPFNIIRGAVNATYNGAKRGELAEGLENAVKHLLDPITGDEIFVGALRDIARGETRDGKNLRYRMDDKYRPFTVGLLNTGRSLGHLGQAVSPGYLQTVERLGRAIMEDERRGHKLKLSNELLALFTGQRKQNQNPMWEVRRRAELAQEALNEGRKIGREATRLREDEKDAKADRRLGQMDHIARLVGERFAPNVRALQTLGYSDAYILSHLNDARLDRDVIIAAFGYMPEGMKNRGEMRVHEFHDMMPALWEMKGEAIDNLNRGR